MYLLRLPSGLYVSSPMTTTTDNPNLAACYSAHDAAADAAARTGAVVVSYYSADLAWRAARAADASPAVASRLEVRRLRLPGGPPLPGGRPTPGGRPGARAD